MKTRSSLSSALLLALFLCACGKKDAPPAAASPDAASPDAAAAPPETAGPAGLPPCPGFLSQESAKGDSQTGASILISRETPDRLVDAYATDLSADGWILKTSLQQGREHHLLFSQGNRFLRLQIGPASPPDGTSRLHLAWGQAAGAAEVREAYEPEIEEAPAAATESSLEW
ncbi:MAG: hypothetical protein EOM72_07090 [Opitutae bacterium]|nr:hypothetical protein [Opitutae bacterium]